MTARGVGTGKPRCNPAPAAGHGHGRTPAVRRAGPLTGASLDRAVPGGRRGAGIGAAPPHRGKALGFRERSGTRPTPDTLAASSRALLPYREGFGP